MRNTLRYRMLLRMITRAYKDGYISIYDMHCLFQTAWRMD